MPHQSLLQYVERGRAWPAHLEGRRFAPGLERPEEPTAADAPASAAKGADRSAAPPAEAAPTVEPDSQVRCPRCGTWRALDHMADVTDVDAGVRGGRTHPFRGTPKADLVLDEIDAREWACDGCRSRWVRRRVISRPDLYQAMGAPAALVAELAQQDPHAY